MAPFGTSCPAVPGLHQRSGPWSPPGEQTGHRAGVWPPSPALCLTALVKGLSLPAVKAPATEGPRTSAPPRFVWTSAAPPSPPRGGDSQTPLRLQDSETSHGTKSGESTGVDLPSGQEAPGPLPSPAFSLSLSGTFLPTASSRAPERLEAERSPTRGREDRQAPRKGLWTSGPGELGPTSPPHNFTPRALVTGLGGVRVLDRPAPSEGGSVRAPLQGAPAPGPGQAQAPRLRLAGGRLKNPALRSPPAPLHIRGHPQASRMREGHALWDGVGVRTQDTEALAQRPALPLVSPPGRPPCVGEPATGPSRWARARPEAGSYELRGPSPAAPPQAAAGGGGAGAGLRAAGSVQTQAPLSTPEGRAPVPSSHLPGPWGPWNLPRTGCAQAQRSHRDLRLGPGQANILLVPFWAKRPEASSRGQGRAHPACRNLAEKGWEHPDDRASPEPTPWAWLWRRRLRGSTLGEARPGGWVGPLAEAPRKWQSRTSLPWKRNKPGFPRGSGEASAVPPAKEQRGPGRPHPRADGELGRACDAASELRELPILRGPLLRPPQPCPARSASARSVR
ncbi:basic proline-rich protein-like [Hippopotamus amphibius kiboko]|uniref:basic proline-rich protein-like n=1 Tax=Hippopotamus amphibius kiboko TaxID=575201 RepID=UPI0025920F11|nr:basic proline-rich protein-like [Hippopotamus amphibius kiboko]